MLFQYILDKRLKEPVRSGPAAAAPDHMLLLCGIIFHSSHHQRKTVIVEPPQPFRLSSSRLPQLVWYGMIAVVVGGVVNTAGYFTKAIPEKKVVQDISVIFIILIINIQGKV